ncbi:DNA replication terminus site-binding protein [Halomonas binhaiensis]|uniref:DNA replication terminus site-binding protein n=2 Tax=Halomonas binhaiensis TaxID=2562282 RepID=A0A5C1NGM1_9GAMM|nr:DNA replication terminus site-binding protein [Halomonas binhaiensis]
MTEDAMSAHIATPAYRLLAELERHFDHIVEGVEEMVDAWQASGLPAWSFDQPQGVDAKWLKHVLSDVWYEDGQDGRATRSHIGLVAVNEATLKKACAVNTAKADFAKVLADIRKEAPTLVPEIKAVIPFRHPELHTHLKGTGLARLHLKQCWRALPIAEAPVAKVRLAWYSSGRSITRLSVAEAERRLMALDNAADHIRIQLKRLAGIPSQEPLAQVQRQAPLMRANLFFAEPLANGKTRRALNVALPLLVPCPSGKLPDHNIPPSSPPVERKRARRSDERLEDEMFLPSLRVYRYRQ